MQTNQPLVSIIINCFNGEKYLNEALTSVVNQSYKNWEVIFWDNQSTDNSAKIYKAYRESRFKYFYAKEHTSLYQARNLAIENSNGELISFLDTDDMWVNNKLELQVPLFKEQDIGVVFSNLWLLKKDKKNKKLYSNQKLLSGRIYNELIKNYNVGLGTTIIKKFYYTNLKKKFDERFSIIGDFDLFLRLSKMCIFKSIQTPLAYYRLHGKNLSTTNKQKEIEEFQVWLEENKDHLEKNHIDNFQKKINYRKFVNCKIDGNYKECIKMFFRSKISIFSIKNLAIFFTPIVFLKKILWYHQD